MADLGQRDIIFAIVEVTFALATAFSLGPTGIVTNEFAWTLMVALGCTGAIVPLLMRMSMKYWQGGSLPKVLEMMVLIWALVLYYIGGIILLVARLDDRHRGRNVMFVPASCALVTAIMCTIDLVFSLCGK